MNMLKFFHLASVLALTVHSNQAMLRAMGRTRTIRGVGLTTVGLVAFDRIDKKIDTAHVTGELKLYANFLHAEWMYRKGMKHLSSQQPIRRPYFYRALQGYEQVAARTKNPLFKNHALLQLGMMNFYGCGCLQDTTTASLYFKRIIDCNKTESVDSNTLATAERMLSYAP